MRVIGMKKEDAWTALEFRTTYKMGWEACLSCARVVWDYTQNAEVLAGDIGDSAHSVVEIKDSNHFDYIPEAGAIQVRGPNKVYDFVPIQIIFFNQSDIVRMLVPTQYLDDMKKSETEYLSEEEKLHTFDKFMDSIELNARGLQTEKFVAKKVAEELSAALLQHNTLSASQCKNGEPLVYRTCGAEVNLTKIINSIKDNASTTSRSTGYDEQSVIEAYVDENCHRDFITLDEFKRSPVWAMRVWAAFGIKKSAPAGKKWSFRPTNRNFLGSNYISVNVYNTYEGALAEMIEKNLDTREEFHYRISRVALTEEFQKDWVQKIHNAKGNFIHVIDTSKINSSIFSKDYSPEPVEPKVKEEPIYITASSLIDWLIDIGYESLSKAEKWAEKLLKHESVLRAIQRYMETDSYDDTILIQGYTAKAVHEKAGDKLSVLGVHNYLVYLIEDPEHAVSDLEKGLPRK